MFHAPAQAADGCGDVTTMSLQLARFLVWVDAKDTSGGGISASEIRKRVGRLASLMPAGAAVTATYIIHSGVFFTWGVMRDLVTSEAFESPSWCRPNASIEGDDSVTPVVLSSSAYVTIVEAVESLADELCQMIFQLEPSALQLVIVELSRVDDGGGKLVPRLLHQMLRAQDVGQCYAVAACTLARRIRADVDCGDGSLIHQRCHFLTDLEQWTTLTLSCTSCLARLLHKLMQATSSTPDAPNPNTIELANLILDLQCCVMSKFAAAAFPGTGARNALAAVVHVINRKPLSEWESVGLSMDVLKAFPESFHRLQKLHPNGDFTETHAEFPWRNMQFTHAEYLATKQAELRRSREQQLSCTPFGTGVTGTDAGGERTGSLQDQLEAIQMLETIELVESAAAEDRTLYVDDSERDSFYVPSNEDRLLFSCSDVVDTLMSSTDGHAIDRLSHQARVYCLNHLLSEGEVPELARNQKSVVLVAAVYRSLIPCEPVVTAKIWKFFIELETEVATDSANPDILKNGAHMRRVLLDTFAENYSIWSEECLIRDNYFADRTSRISNHQRGCTLLGGDFLNDSEYAHELHTLESEVTQIFNRMVSSKQETTVAMDVAPKISRPALLSPLILMRKICRTAATNPGSHTRDILRGLLECLGCSFLSYRITTSGLLVTVITEELQSLHPGKDAQKISNLTQFVGLLFGLSSPQPIAHDVTLQHELIDAVVLPHLSVSAAHLPTALRVLLLQLGQPVWESFPALAAAFDHASLASAAAYLNAVLIIFQCRIDVTITALCKLLAHRTDLDSTILGLTVDSLNRCMCIFEECGDVASQSLDSRNISSLLQNSSLTTPSMKVLREVLAQKSTAIAAVVRTSHWSVGLYLQRNSARYMRHLGDLVRPRSASSCSETADSDGARQELVENLMMASSILGDRIENYMGELREIRDCLDSPQPVGSHPEAITRLVRYMVDHPTNFRHIVTLALAKMLPQLVQAEASRILRGLLPQLVASALLQVPLAAAPVDDLDDKIFGVHGGDPLAPPAVKPARVLAMRNSETVAPVAALQLGAMVAAFWLDVMVAWHLDPDSTSGQQLSLSSTSMLESLRWPYSDGTSDIIAEGQPQLVDDDDDDNGGDDGDESINQAAHIVVQHVAHCLQDAVKQVAADGPVSAQLISTACSLLRACATARPQHQSFSILAGCEAGLVSVIANIMAEISTVIKDAIAAGTSKDQIQSWNLELLANIHAISLAPYRKQLLGLYCRTIVPVAGSIFDKGESVASPPVEPAPECEPASK
jgi:hypothetical protein